MNKMVWTLGLVLLTSSCQWTTREVQNQIKTPIFNCTPLIDNDGNPCPTLLALLDHLNIKHDGSLKSITEITQQQWLRKPGLERWQVQEIQDIDHLFIMPYLEKFGMLHEWTQSIKTYDYIIVFGGMVSRVRRRIAHLAHLWELGFRTQTLVFLTGARPLDPEIENETILKDRYHKELPARNDWIAPQELPRTEDAMMTYIFDQAQLPQDLKTVKPILISVPMLKKDDGCLHRPSTGDTVTAWLKTNPTPGTCLIVSNQPYIGYQCSVAQGILPPSFKMFPTGPGIHDIKETPVAVYLDTLARRLYEEKTNFDKVKK